MNPYLRSQSVDRTGFLPLCFTFMAIALALSGVVAYLFGTHTELTELLYRVNEKHKTVLTLTGWVVLLAPLPLVFALGYALKNSALSVMFALFLLFSILMGMSLSSVFLTYTNASIGATFFIAAGMFISTAGFGYITKTDLSKIGNLAGMALWGLILAGIVNIFLRNTMFDFIISGVGVLVFTVLTAYDVKKLKELTDDVDTLDDDSRTKVALMGAVTLYLDFVNMFLYLLRFFGNKKD